MVVRELNNHSIFHHPERWIDWRKTKYHLYLNAKLEWPRGDSIRLSPSELGRCKEWMSSPSRDHGFVDFTAKWEIRAVKSEWLDTINRYLAGFAILRD